MPLVYHASPQPPERERHARGTDPGIPRDPDAGYARTVRRVKMAPAQMAPAQMAPAQMAPAQRAPAQRALTDR